MNFCKRNRQSISKGWWATLYTPTWLYSQHFHNKTNNSWWKLTFFAEFGRYVDCRGLLSSLVIPWNASRSEQPVEAYRYIRLLLPLTWIRNLPHDEFAPNNLWSNCRSSRYRHPGADSPYRDIRWEPKQESRIAWWEAYSREWAEDKPEAQPQPEVLWSHWRAGSCTASPSLLDCRHKQRSEATWTTAGHAYSPQRWTDPPNVGDCHLRKDLLEQSCSWPSSM